MENALEQHYEAFAGVLSEEGLEQLAAEYEVVDQRRRSLPVYIFFWLMVLSSGQPGARSCLFQLTAFFIAGLSGLFSLDKVVRLSKMAVSKKLKTTKWEFFRAVYRRLLEHYERLLPLSERQWLKTFKDAFAVDGSIARVYRTLEQFFASVNKGKAALKMNTKFSIKNLTPKEVEVSSGKRHDSRYNGVTEEAGVLYLFDLGYWGFRLFENICKVKSFFISRLKSSCDPLIVAVEGVDLAFLVGKRLSDALPLLVGLTELDVKVQLSKAKHPCLRTLRLVGLLHEGTWRFWVTNIVDPDFTPLLIFTLYRQRWLVELFFNHIKHCLHVESIFSRNENGIMVEIYSALIFYLLTQIVMALAAIKNNQPLEAFSFKKTCELFKAFLLSNLSHLLCRTEDVVLNLLRRVVLAVALVGFRSQPSVLT